VRADADQEGQALQVQDRHPQGQEGQGPHRQAQDRQGRGADLQEHEEDRDRQRATGLVKVKKKVRVSTYEKCKSAGPSSAGAPVKVTLLEGSSAKPDFGALVREAPITGTLTGLIPGGYKLDQDDQINLTRGNLALGTRGRSARARAWRS
jgi:hypothetical protein